MHSVTVAGLVLARWGHGSFSVTGYGLLAVLWVLMMLAGAAAMWGDD